MIRFKAIVIRVIKELVRDKRTLALMLIAPVFILTLMNVVFDTNSDIHVKIGIDETVPTSLVENFPSDVKTKKYNNQESAKEMIKADDLDAYITRNDSELKVTYKNEDPSTTAQIKSLIQQSLTADRLKEMSAEIQKAAQQNHASPAIPSFTMKNTYVYGDKDSTFFDKISPILIGFFVFFFVFLVSGIALLRERTSGTLERLLATPVKRSEIVFGYMVGYGIFAIVQTLLIVFYAIYVLDLQIVGDLWLVLLTNSLITLTALAMGIFVSTFANSEFQMVQFIPVVVIPQLFFSGLIPLDTMNDWIKNIAFIFPLSYAGRAMTNIMIKGQGIAAIWQDLAVLVLFILFFTLLNITGLKRYRKV